MSLSVETAEVTLDHHLKFCFHSLKLTFLFLHNLLHTFLYSFFLHTRTYYITIILLFLHIP
jgi:hypothetical protein